jgi:hypothetical protein
MSQKKSLYLRYFAGDFFLECHCPCCLGHMWHDRSLRIFQALKLNADISLSHATKMFALEPYRNLVGDRLDGVTIVTRWLDDPRFCLLDITSTSPAVTTQNIR